MGYVTDRACLTIPQDEEAAHVWGVVSWSDVQARFDRARCPALATS